MGCSMAIVAPHVRQHLSADARLRLVHSGFARLPEHRLDDTEMAFTDALMSACAMFSLTAPALLACDKERAEGTVPTLYGLARVPCDTHRRTILDPVSPKGFRPVCTRVFRPLQRGTALEPLVFWEGHSVLALDGTASFSSQTMHGAACLQKVPRHGAITSLHQRLGAAIMHPDRRDVMPLMPAPIVQHEGTDTNACERHAAKRCVATWRQDHPPLQCLVTADSLSSHAPHLETLHAHGLPSILGVKEGDQASLFQQVQAAEDAGRGTSYERHDRAAGVSHRFRFVHDMPLKASHPNVRGHCIEYGELGPHKVQHCSGVTDLRVRKRNV